MKFGVIGGSGLYEMDGLENIQTHKVETPFGDPSDELISGTLEGKEVIFLPRHGKGHRILPSEINYRANIWALKSMGVDHLITVSAVGSLKEEIEPGHIVIPDQFFDRTKDRPSTFFGNGIVGHIQFGKPFCKTLSEQIFEASGKVGVKTHKGGTYVCMEGPIFSTQAESFFYRSIDASVIGMTNLQEAKLAREAEMCFAGIALSTDYDCWHEEEVTIEAILEVMGKNVGNSKAILKQMLSSYPDGDHKCACHESLKFGIITQPDLIPDQVKKDLAPIIGKYVK